MPCKKISLGPHPSWILEVLFFMPRVFEKEGYRFFFYSNEHSPVHVHVTKGDGEAILHLGPPMEVQESFGMKVRELARAVELAEENRGLILKIWNEHHN